MAWYQINGIVAGRNFLLVTYDPHIYTLERKPSVRNAIDGQMAAELVRIFRQFDADEALSTEEALRNETRRGLAVIHSGETAEGASRFRAGHGRHGSAHDI